MIENPNDERCDYYCECCERNDLFIEDLTCDFGDLCWTCFFKVEAMVATGMDANDAVTIVRKNGTEN